MKFLASNEWLKGKIENDPDVSCEVGPPIEKHRFCADSHCGQCDICGEPITSDLHIFKKRSPAQKEG